MSNQVVDHKLYGSRAEFEDVIHRVLVEFGVELVCLAGFMRILTGTFVRRWTGMTSSTRAVLKTTMTRPRLTFPFLFL